MRNYDIDWRLPYELPTSGVLVLCEYIDGSCTTMYIPKKIKIEEWNQGLIRWAYVDFSYKDFIMDYKYIVDPDWRSNKNIKKSKNDNGLNSVGKSFLQAKLIIDDQNCDESGKDPDDNSWSGDSMWPDYDPFIPEPISDEEVAAERESAKSFFEAFRKDIERYYANEEDDRK